MSFNPKAKYVNGAPLMVDYTPAASALGPNGAGTCNAGDVILVGGKLGISHTDQLVALTVGAISEGRAVYDVVNDTTQLYSAGSLVAWDTTNQYATASTTNTLNLGTAIGAQASGSTATTIRTIVGPLRMQTGM